MVKISGPAGAARASREIRWILAYGGHGLVNHIRYLRGPQRRAVRMSKERLHSAKSCGHLGGAKQPERT